MRKILLFSAVLIMLAGAGCVPPLPDQNNNQSANQDVENNTVNGTATTNDTEDEEDGLIETATNSTPENTACGKIINIASNDSALVFFSSHVEVCEGLFNLYLSYKNLDDRMLRSAIQADPKGSKFYEFGAWLTLDPEGIQMLKMAEDIATISLEANEAFQANMFDNGVNAKINRAKALLDPWQKSIKDFEVKWGVGPQN